MTKFTPFDAADYLNNEEDIAEYLTAALEYDDQEMFQAALKDVARAHGRIQAKKYADLPRESFYKGLPPGAKPHYNNVLEVVRALSGKRNAGSV